MRRRDDDLSPFRDDPVFQALTAPATDDELAGEAEAVAAFRAAAAARPRRRLAARIGTGGAVAVAVIGLTGGVAAAYTASLPTSAQRVLHDALGAIGVPAPHHHHHQSSGSTPSAVSPAPVPIPMPSGGSSAPHSPSAIGESATPSSSATPTLPVVVPTATPSATPTGTPTPTPTPTRTGVFHGATLAISVSARKVAVGGSVTVTGRLDAADSIPIAGKKVGLRYRRTGVPGWTRLGPQSTAADGSVTFTVSGLDHNVRLVLHAGRHVRSAVTTVVIVPTITVNVAPPAPSAVTTEVTVTVTGGQPGDVVTVRRAGGRGLQRATLDDSLTATFTLQVAQRRNIQYRVFVAGSQAHARHSLAFYVPQSATSTGQGAPAA